MHIIAETDPRCEVRVDKLSGSASILQATPGIYWEVQVINYLPVPVTIIHEDGSRDVVVPTIDIHHNPRVEIRHRKVVGARSFEEYQSGNRVETTPGHKPVLVVPRAALVDQPVFVRSHNLLLCLNEHVEAAIHPNSEQARKIELKRLYDELTRAAVESPVMIIANDPSRTYPQIFTTLYGRICAATVRHFRGDGERDRIIVMVRDTVSDQAEPRFLAELSFAELAEAGVWEKDGITLCLNRAQLRTHLDVKAREELRGTISKAHHERTIERLKKEHAHDVSELKEQLERTRNQHRAAQEVIKTLDDPLATPGAGEVRRRELEVEAQALDAKRRQIDLEQARAAEKAANDLALARIRRSETLISTAGSVIKVIGVGLTVGLAIYKAVAK